jgi:hypothetical protein
MAMAPCDNADETCANHSLTTGTLLLRRRPQPTLTRACQLAEVGPVLGEMEGSSPTRARTEHPSVALTLSPDLFFCAKDLFFGAKPLWGSINRVLQG